MRLHIKNGIRADLEAAPITDLFIIDGIIKSIDIAPKDFHADQTIDATDRWLLPGLVDICVRIPEPGFPQKGTIASETRAAALRGVLHMVSIPDTRPCIDTAALASRVQMQAQLSNFANIYPLGALTTGLQGTQLADLVALTDAGCPAVTNAQCPIQNTRTLLQCYQYAASNNILVVIRADDADLSDKTFAQEGSVSSRLGLPARPGCTEALAISRHLHLISYTGVRAHFSCITTAKGVDLIRAAKKAGLPITADTAMHYLHLTEEAMMHFDSNARLDPPLGTSEDRAALRTGLCDGTLQAVCSDHRPQEETAKFAPFGDAAPGLSGVETLLSLGIALIQENIIPRHVLLHAMTAGPADCLGLIAGRITVGGPADMVLVNPTACWTVGSTTLQSRGLHTPFLGNTLPGIVTQVLHGGRCLL